MHKPNSECYFAQKINRRPAGQTSKSQGLAGSHIKGFDTLTTTHWSRSWSRKFSAAYLIVVHARFSDVMSLAMEDQRYAVGVLLSYLRRRTNSCRASLANMSFTLECQLRNWRSQGERDAG